MDNYSTIPDSDNLENPNSDNGIAEMLMEFCGSHGYGVTRRDVNYWIAIKFGGVYRSAWPTRAAAYEACLNQIITDSWVKGNKFKGENHE